MYNPPQSHSNPLHHHNSDSNSEDRLYMVYANLIPQVGALSLNGRIFTCMLLDPDVTPGVDKLGDYFIEELLELAKATGQGNVTRADVVAEEE